MALKTRLSVHTPRRNNTCNIRMKVILVRPEAENCNCPYHDKGRSELQ